MMGETTGRYESRNLVRFRFEPTNHDTGPRWINAVQVVANVERTYEGGYRQFLAEEQYQKADPEVTYRVDPRNRDLLIGSDASLWKRA